MTTHKGGMWLVKNQKGRSQSPIWKRNGKSHGLFLFRYVCAPAKHDCQFKSLFLKLFQTQNSPKILFNFIFFEIISNVINNYLFNNKYTLSDQYWP